MKHPREVTVMRFTSSLDQGCPFLTKETTEIGTIKYIYFSGYYQSLTTEAPI
ncbi:hypothetical protein Ple7327_2242 [Pleurocapsa sp. PCC 7327]|nr:hypothetical protein Ple7327_2242 [Pleurocapsa sp. PCC 7327]